MESNQIITWIFIHTYILRINNPSSFQYLSPYPKRRINTNQFKKYLKSEVEGKFSLLFS